MEQDFFIATVMYMGRFKNVKNLVSKKKMLDLDIYRKKVAIMNSIFMITPEEYYKVYYHNKTPFEKIFPIFRRRIIAEVENYLAGRDLYKLCMKQQGVNNEAKRS